MRTDKMDTPAISFYHKTANGTNLHYTQTGNELGPLIILLHGLGGSTKTFESLLPFLSPHLNRLVCVDFEGFGQTALSTPETVLSIPRYVNDLEYLVASLQDHSQYTAGTKLILIGHSLGAIVSMHYASRHPSQIRGLALLGPGRSIAHISAARERMLGLAAKTRMEGIQAAADMAAISNFPTQGSVALEARESVREAVNSCDAEAYARACEAVANLNHLDPDYSSINAPTLLLAGSGDIISPVERSLGLKELIGDGAWVRVLDGVGHQMLLQDLTGSVEAIQELLEKSN
jgi:pimeloyl-ACP methyl ester carboxylesterase